MNLASGELRTPAVARCGNFSTAGLFAGVCRMERRCTLSPIRAHTRAEGFVLSCFILHRLNQLWWHPGSGVLPPPQCPRSCCAVMSHNSRFHKWVYRLQGLNSKLCNLVQHSAAVAPLRSIVIHLHSLLFDFVADTWTSQPNLNCKRDVASRH